MFVVFVVVVVVVVVAGGGGTVEVVVVVGGVAVVVVGGGTVEVVVVEGFDRKTIDGGSVGVAELVVGVEIGEMVVGVAGGAGAWFEMGVGEGGFVGVIGIDGMEEIDRIEVQAGAVAGIGTAGSGVVVGVVVEVVGAQHNFDEAAGAQPSHSQPHPQHRSCECQQGNSHPFPPPNSFCCGGFCEECGSTFETKKKKKENRTFCQSPVVKLNQTDKTASGRGRGTKTKIKMLPIVDFGAKFRRPPVPQRAPLLKES